MTYDFFLAGRFRNKEAIQKLADAIRVKGKTVYCFLESEEASISIEEFEILPNWREHETVRKIFAVDLAGLKNAETFLLLLPAGKSAHIEAGIAFGLGKPCIVVGEQKEAESLYLIFQKHFESTEEFLKTL